MAKPTKSPHSGSAAAEQAAKIARATQRPGQTKEQTRLIAQGIRKGIEQYKKEQAAKARELDRKLKKLDQQLSQAGEPEAQVHEIVRHRQHWLPWLLLLCSWLGMGAYLVLF